MNSGVSGTCSTSSVTQLLRDGGWRWEWGGGGGRGRSLTRNRLTAQQCLSQLTIKHSVTGNNMLSVYTPFKNTLSGRGLEQESGRETSLSSGQPWLIKKVMQGLTVLFIPCPCVHPLVFYCVLRAHARSLTLLHYITFVDTFTLH